MKGPTYIWHGVVWRHVQKDWSYYLHQFEPVRRATLLERLLWIFGVEPPHLSSKGNKE